MPEGRSGQASLKRQNANTFGDQERICAKNFERAYRRLQADGRSTDGLEQELKYLRELAELYKRSAISTQNFQNVLQASGLLNVCLAKAQHQEVLREQVLQDLMEYSSSMMRRVLRIKVGLAERIHDWEVSRQHHDELNETRRLFNADIRLLASCVQQLPDGKALLSGPAANRKQLETEDKVIAVTSTMLASVQSSIARLLHSLFSESEHLLGPAPCRHALIMNSHRHLGVYSPYESVACFMLIESSKPSWRNYYRTLLTLLSMKVMNVGETAVSCLRLNCLSWYDSERLSGFTLRDIIKDTERKQLTSLPTQNVYTLAEIRKASVSNCVDDRSAVKDICRGAEFVSGDWRLYKELCSLRYAVIQREQADRLSGERSLVQLSDLISDVDPFGLQSFSSGSKMKIRQKILEFPLKFLQLVFDLDKSLVSSSLISSLEEMTPRADILGYSTMSLETVVKGDTLQTHCVVSSQYKQLANEVVEATPVTPVHTSILTFQKTKSSSTRTSLDGSPVVASDDGVLKQLKQRKYEHAEREADHYKAHTEKPNMEVEAIGHTKRAKREGAREHQVTGGMSHGKTTAKHDSAVTTDRIQGKLSNEKRLSIKPQIPRRNIEPKNASNRVVVQQVKAVAEATPVIAKPQVVPYDRLICRPPVFPDVRRGSLSSQSVHQLLLFYSLAAAVSLSDDRSQQLTTETTPNSLSQASIDQAFLTVLQILMPILDHLKLFVKNKKQIHSLSRSLASMDINACDRGELAVGVVNYQEGRYQQACQCIYKFLENRSDVTFIGDPMPCDLSEVCHDLLEDSAMSLQTFLHIHTLLGHCHIQMEDFPAAIQYFQELVQYEAEPLKQVHAHLAIADCSIRLKRFRDAAKCLDLAQYLIANSRLSQASEGLSVTLKTLRDKLPSVSDIRTS